MAGASENLTIAHVDAETGFSGGEVQVFLLLDGLSERGHGQVLFCPPGSRSEQAARERGIDVEAVPMRADLDLAAVRRLAAGFGRRAPDLVHLHTSRATWLGGLAARWRGLPAVTTRRQDKRVKRGWRTRLIYGSLVERAVAISPAVRRRLEEGGVAPDSLSTISSSVDPAALTPSRPREQTRESLGVEGDAPLLLVLAALVRRKGVDVLLAALERADDRCVLVVAGDGEERAALERDAGRRGLAERVRFLGHREDKADLLAACDLFVLPSRLEGLGVAALEAMSAGRPVVASAVGGLGEAVVDGETGRLVPPEDPKRLAAALDELIADPDLAARMGAAGRERIAGRYDATGMVEAYEELYREVLAGGGRT